MIWPMAGLDGLDIRWSPGPTRDSSSFGSDQARTRATAQLELEDEGTAGVMEPGHAPVRFTNPTSGGGPLTTMRTGFHRLRAGAGTRPARTSASSVWQVSAAAAA